MRTNIIFFVYVTEELYSKQKALEAARTERQSPPAVISASARSADTLAAAKLQGYAEKVQVLMFS